ncbi:hypothetical protein B0H14DRAFT_731335 [Mycena olivaceomarginata]|nr:hypothetical protein B0H14DRAFT_731335 [Mycena olivaceomarginata]
MSPHKRLRTAPHGAILDAPSLPLPIRHQHPLPRASAPHRQQGMPVLLPLLAPPFPASHATQTSHTLETLQLHARILPPVPPTRPVQQPSSTSPAPPHRTRTRSPAPPIRSPAPAPPCCTIVSRASPRRFHTMSAPVPAPRRGKTNMTLHRLPPLTSPLRPTMHIVSTPSLRTTVFLTSLLPPTSEHPASTLAHDGTPMCITSTPCSHITVSPTSSLSPTSVYPTSALAHDRTLMSLPPYHRLPCPISTSASRRRKMEPKTQVTVRRSSLQTKGVTKTMNAQALLTKR